MPICFVIQPFDKGPFDKRYDQTLSPAIKRAGMTPYRVDRDPNVTIPIEAIEEQIKRADFCLADISVDNPNVWYEVGYAIAFGKDVVLLSNEGRSAFPFDIQHRKVISYSTHSPSDFEHLSQNIVDRLIALYKLSQRAKQRSPLSPLDGLSPHEINVLVILMEERDSPESGEYPYAVKNKMQKAGYTKIASTLAFVTLENMMMIERGFEYNRNGDDCEVLRLTNLGVQWCVENRDRLVLEIVPQPPTRNPTQTVAFDEDDDIPF